MFGGTLLTECVVTLRALHSVPTRRSSDLPLLPERATQRRRGISPRSARVPRVPARGRALGGDEAWRSEEHTSELQSLRHLVCRLLLEKKNLSTVVAATSIVVGLYATARVT